MKKKKIIFIIAIVFILVGIGFLAFPFYPRVALEFQKASDPTDGFRYESTLAVAAEADIEVEELKPIPKDNRLVIPKIQVDAPILEGNSIGVLKEGLWHRPKTVNPNEVGNSVIIGHRNLRGMSTPITLSNLNLIKVGDQFMVFWEGQEIDYEVVETRVIRPNDFSVEANTDDQRLTIYTCTLDSKKRVLVVAKPEARLSLSG